MSSSVLYDSFSQTRASVRIFRRAHPTAGGNYGYALPGADPYHASISLIGMVQMEGEMQSLKNILVVSGDDAEQARDVLEKANMLADATGARLHVVRIIYEGIAELGAAAIDATHELKTLMLQAAETALEDTVADVRARHPDLEAAALWNPRHWEGVLHAAERAEADLVIKAASVHHKFGDIVRTPDDWNLDGCTIEIHRQLGSGFRPKCKISIG